MKRKILMMLNSPYPADMRVRKEASALISAGFQVHLLCLRKATEKAEETVEGMVVRRIDAGKNNYQLARWDVVMSVTSVHPKFLAAARSILQANDISIIHVHDLPLCGTALKLKAELKSTVVLDMHENYPEALRTWFSWKKNPIVRLKNMLFMNPKRWTKIEQQACQQCDHIIAVVDEMKTRITRDYGIQPDKITVVTNTEDKGFISQKVDDEVYGPLRKKFIVTYSGGIGPHRGVDVAIKGMGHLRDNADIHLAIVGFGSPSVMKSLKRLSRRLKLQNVHFIGYQPFSKFYSYMRFASVNLIPHQSNGHTDNTVPHKLFQGMMAGRPLLVSSSAPLKRIVTQCESGLVFKAGDDADFAEKVKVLYRDKPLADRLGVNGKNATVNGNLTWEKTQSILVNLYASIADTR